MKEWTCMSSLSVSSRGRQHPPAEEEQNKRFHVGRPGLVLWVRPTSGSGPGSDLSGNLRSISSSSPDWRQTESSPLQSAETLLRRRCCRQIVMSSFPVGNGAENQQNTEGRAEFLRFILISWFTPSLVTSIMLIDNKEHVPWSHDLTSSHTGNTSRWWSSDEQIEKEKWQFRNNVCDGQTNQQF